MKPTLPGARTPLAHPALSGVIVILSVGILVAAYLALRTGTPIPSPSPTPESGAYRNEQYGFSIALPTSWQGYSVISTQWEGRDVATGQVIAHGPLITLRHPQWTQQAPREDMPVMVFTLAQWDLVQQEKLAVGAAPIPPSQLGRNSQYILALPARYNYDFRPGWEEVDQFVHTLKALEPMSGGATQSGISGKVLVGPTCPVQRVGDPSCDDKPYQGAFIVKNTDGTQVARFSTDSNGNFMTLLDPGAYTIEPVQRIGIAKQSQTVTIVSGKMSNVTLTYDTGIR